MTANIDVSIAKTMLSKKRNSFTVIKKSIPPISNVKIIPGILIKLHFAMAAIISPTKLFARIRQETRVNMQGTNTNPAVIP